MLICSTLELQHEDKVNVNQEKVTLAMVWTYSSIYNILKITRSSSTLYIGIAMLVNSVFTLIINDFTALNMSKN